MSLIPKFPVAVVDVLVPSLGKKIKFARFRVAEERLLLIAKESGEYADILLAVKQMIENCLQDPTIDIEKLSMVDLEWLFVKLYAASVNNVISITVHDPEDDQDYKFDVNLDDVKIDTSSLPDPMIKLSNKYAVKMIYPPASLYGSKEMLQSKDPVSYLIARCVAAVYVEDSVFETKNATEHEMDEWVLNLDSKTYKTLREFIDAVPSMEYQLKYTNSKGTERNFTLKTLSDFFTL